MAVAKPKVKTVTDHAAENPVAAAQSFSEQAADSKVKNESRYAVEGNDLSGFIGVSEEYMTYVGDTEGDVDSPVGFDSKAQDNVNDRDSENKKDDDESEKSGGTTLPMGS